MPRGFSALALIALAGASAVAACSSSDGSHAAPIGSGGSGDAASGGSSASGGSGGTRQTNGGSGGSSASHGGNAGNGVSSAGADENGGASSDAGAGGEGPPGTVVVVEPGACSETAMWTGAAPLTGISTADTEKLLSLTLDELDIAFLRGGALYRAHRDAASSDFGAATAVTLPAGYDASSGAALSQDGLTLVLIASTGDGFGSVSRTARDADFGATIDTDAFAGLNARAIQTLEHYAAPVLSLDGKTLVFSGFTPGAAGLAVVYESTLSAGEWSMPNNVSADIFNGTGTARPLPTGLSSDSRTLFYLDEGTGKEVARFRDRPDAPLYDHVDLGDLAGATPNSKCDRIYYTAGDNVLTETD